MPDIVYVNGKFVSITEASIPIDERGHQFGDGVYEVIRVYNGKPFLLDWHIERLFHSLRAIRIENPFTYHECRNMLVESVNKSKLKEATIYIQVTRGIAPRSHLFPPVNPSVTFIFREYKRNYQSGKQKLLLWPDERWANAYIKTLNLLPNILAKQSAHDVGAFEALLVRDGHMLEASSANVWFVISGKLITAPTNRFILPGITRRFVHNIVHEIGIPLEERPVHLNEIESIDEVFLTGTTTEVHSIDEIIVANQHRPVSDGLSDTPSDYPALRAADCSSVWIRKEGSHLFDRIRAEFQQRVDII